ncbi:MAG: DedA family protein [Alphaproteobacteria bacterium]|nr:DedA family protein [Alphaproteobacteria bacterium]
MTGAGYGGLFVTAFLAATLLPLSSEAVLAALAAAAGFDLYALVAVATAGNTLGALVNWLLGRFCLRWRNRRWFPVDAARLGAASDWFRRYGVWSLLLAWVPVIGDPLTFVAGFLGIRLAYFLPLVALGKAARYAVIAGLAQALFG